MKKVKSWYLPDNENHFEREMTSKNVDGYQVPSRKATLKKIKKLPGFIPLLALDVGANVGFWTRDLARIFKKVNAYEPLPENIECLINNVPDKNVFVKKFALGDKTEVKELMIPQNGNCGSATFQDSNIVDKCEINRLDVPVKTLDNELASETTEMLQNCFIKIDTQGHENEVLQGAETFINVHKPVICCEVRANRENVKPAIKFFENINYKLYFNYKKEFTFISKQRFPKRF